MNSFTHKFLKSLCATVFVLNIISCSNIPDEETQEPKPTFKLSKEAKPKVPIAQTGVIEAISPLQALNKNSKLILPQRTELKNKTLPPLTYRLADIMKSRAADPKTFDKNISLNMNLDNLTIDVVIKAFQSDLDFSYILDPAVTGTIKSEIYLEDTITRHGAWTLFEQVLFLSGAYANVDSSGVLRIMPLTKLPQDKQLQFAGKSGGTVSVEYFPLSSANAVEVLKTLSPFLSNAASTTIITKNNAILVVETNENIGKIRDLIEMLDNKGQADWPQLAYKVNHTDSATLLAELESAMPVLGFTVAAGSPDGNGVKMASLERMQVIVISAPTQSVLNELYRWIQILDTAESSDEEKVYYYPVRHGISTDLADAVAIFFSNTTAGSSSSRSSSNNNTSSRANSNNRATASQAPSRNTPTRSNSSTRKPNSDEIPASIFDYPVTIFEDQRRNQLVIRTVPKTFAMLNAILKHLDAPAMQVLVKVTAVEVELTKGLEYGFEYAANQDYGDYNGSGGIGNAVSSEPIFSPAGAVTPGISLLMEKAGIDNGFAFVQAVANDAVSKLLFTPQLMTLNGEEAEINIGSSVPIQSGSTTTVGSGTTNNIEYRDVGVILRITPQISYDKKITLEAEVELSSVSTEIIGTDDIQSPTINENKIKTTLLVNDNETILLGGIIHKSETKVTSGVPYLKDIPFIGLFFQGADSGSRRKELLIFLKATVIDENSDHQKIIDEFQEAVAYVEHDVYEDDDYATALPEIEEGTEDITEEDTDDTAE